MKIKISNKERQVILEALWLLDSNINKNNNDLIAKIQDGTELSDSENEQYSLIKPKCDIINGLILKLDVICNPFNKSYLDPLSNKAKQFVLDHKPNIYHSVMSNIDLDHKYNRVKNKEDFLNYYLQKNGSERPYLLDHIEELKEIIGLCYLNYDRHND